MKSENAVKLEGFLRAMEADLIEHIEVCRAIYHIIEREARALHAADPGDEFSHTNEARKKLLPILDKSLARIRMHRTVWEKIPSEKRQRCERIRTLLTQGQNIVMKIMTLDRDNENCLLKRGAIPVQHIPSARRQQPGYVAGLYEKNAGASAPGAS